MGAYDEDQYRFLADEKELLRKAVAQGVPVLGICLGCQLLADALGGRAYKADTHELEFSGLKIAPRSVDDPVLSLLADPVVSFHGDTWDPPPSAAVVVTSSRYNHAFRLGSAVAIQAHPEASASMAGKWVESHGREMLVAEGNDPESFLAAVRQGEAANRDRALRLFAAWFDEMVALDRCGSPNREVVW